MAAVTVHSWLCISQGKKFVFLPTNFSDAWWWWSIESKALRGVPQIPRVTKDL